METSERIGGVLVLDSKVATVETDLDVLEQRAPGLVRGEAELGRERRTANRRQPSLEEVIVRCSSRGNRDSGWARYRGG
jgi:hypothetical protein